MRYEDLNFIIPYESNTYQRDSDFVIKQITDILDERARAGANKIFINTSLRAGLPLENINKIAGPMIEAWACEVFEDALSNGKYGLICVTPQARLDMADIILQFAASGYEITGSVDVKATAADIATSGLSPNITSFARIRTAYVEQPNFMFIVLSLKHKVYSQHNPITGLVDGVMEIESYHAFDLKFIGEDELRYNPSLGSGQIQIKDINRVSYHYRTTWEMCQLLDQKFLNSSRRNIDDFYREAKKNQWLAIYPPSAGTR